MFSSLRTRFGIPGVISVVALVFAMLGGAYAAQSNGGGKATASAKAKKGPRGPKGATGPAGPAGPVGPAGPAGANGKAGADGAKGTTGANGSNGQSVTTTHIEPFEDCADQEGVMLHSASGEEKVCDGAEGPQGAPGSPWTAGGTLPVGKTETGTFVAYGMSDDAFGIYAPIGFPIPLVSALPEANVHYQDGPGFAANCAGTVANPTATSGHLCVYAGVVIGADAPEIIKTDDLSPGSLTAGAIVGFHVAAPSAIAAGTWAVTG